MHMEVVKPKTPDGATTVHYPLGGSTFGWARVYGLDRRREHTFRAEHKQHQR